MSRVKDAFGHKIFGNIGWQALAVLGRLGITIAALAVLARIAGPEVMGVFGLAWVAISLGFAISKSGAAQSIIVIKNLRQSHVAASFSLTMGLSGLFSLIMIVCAPAVGTFYGLYKVEQAYVMGAMFVPLMALGSIDMAIAQKQLDFRLIARIQTLSSTLSAVSSIILAIYCDPLLGLFALQGLSGVFQFILFRLHGHSCPPVRFTMTDLREIWTVGMHLSFNSITSIMLINLPQLIIARILPMESVGIFTLTRRIIEVVGSQIGGVVNQVIYPSFATIRGEHHKVAEPFLSTTHLTIFFMMLPLLLLASSPGDFLTLYAGDYWRSGEMVLLLLVIMQMGLAIGQNVFATFQAIGQPSAVWRWNLFLMMV